MPDLTYIDQYIADGQNDTLSLKNFYETILVGNKNNEDHIFRIPINDFFLKYRNELAEYIQIYQLPQELFYKPKILSLQEYGTTELWLSILRVNGMKNITEFHQPYIRLYQPAAVKEIIKIFFKREGKA